MNIDDDIRRSLSNFGEVGFPLQEIQQRVYGWKSEEEFSEHAVALNQIFELLIAQRTEIVTLNIIRRIRKSAEKLEHIEGLNLKNIADQCWSVSFMLRKMIAELFIDKSKEAGETELLSKIKEYGIEELHFSENFVQQYIESILDDMEAELEKD